MSLINLQTIDMWLLLTGEGKTDMGECDASNDYCEGDNFKAGAMAWFVDQLIDNYYQLYEFSHINYQLVSFIPKAKITELSLLLKIKKKPSFSGAKQKKETLYYQRNARAFAIEAKKLEIEKKIRLLLFFFVMAMELNHPFELNGKKNLILY